MAVGICENGFGVVEIYTGNGSINSVNGKKCFGGAKEDIGGENNKISGIVTPDSSVTCRVGGHKTLPAVC